MSVELLLSQYDVNEALLPARRSFASVGFVPTMGALHDGHRSLIERSASENDITVVSIFINPKQFDDENDLAAYPKTMEADIAVCEEAGADFIYCPSAEEMYPDGFSTYVDMGGATEKLCGASRPGHFRGVLTVVNKLFNIVSPAAVYFGEKDAQQLFLIRKMVRELNMPVAIIPCRTYRDRDLLATSSRNAGLSDEERSAASCLVRALMKACTTLSYAGIEDDPIPEGLPFDAEKVKRQMIDFIEAEPLARLDYAEIVDGDTFEDVTRETNNVLLAVAAYFGKTRLIDNMTFKLNGHEYGCPCCS